MSSLNSTESIMKQLCSGILSGSVVGVLFSRRERLLSYLTFTSIGLIDLAYHWNYLKAHITHLSYRTFGEQRPIRAHFNELQRTIRREFRHPDDDLNQEVQWLANDIRQYIDQHIYYGMGFTLAFLVSVVLVPKRSR